MLETYLQFLTRKANEKGLKSAPTKVLLALLEEGKTKKEVIDNLHISEPTFRSHMNIVYSCFGIEGKGTGKLEKLRASLKKEYQQSNSLASASTKTSADNRDYLVQQQSLHSAEVRQPQEPAQEETPSKNTDFVGREEAIAHLDSLVKDGSKVILIQAEGGVGKTTLTRKWFELQRLEYLEFSVGMTRQTIYPAEDWVRQTLRSYFDENPEQNFRAMLEQLKHKLQSERIGVLINNLEVALFNGEFIEPHQSYYVELLTVLAHSSVNSITLVTSREPLYEPGIMGLQTFQTYLLEGLKKKAWEKYFDSQNISLNINTLSEMHRAYGGNALAMDLLSSDIRKQSQGNLEVYWQENRDDLLRHPTLEKLVQRQFNKLRDDNSQAHELLCRFGFYPNLNFPAVPKVWLFCLLWDVPEKRRQRVIDDLYDRSLLKVNDEGYYLHPMIRVEAVERLLRGESNHKKLLLIKSQIDALLPSNEQNDSLQEFLVWLSKKTNKVTTLWKLAVIRACYFFISLECEFTSAFPIIKSIDPNWDRELDRVYYLPHSSGFDMDLILAHSLGCDLDLSLYRVLVHTLSYANEPTIELPPSLASRFSALNAFYFSMARDEAKNINYALKFDISSKLKELLEKIKTQIEIKQPNIINTIKHRKETSLSFVEELREVMIEEHDIGHNWQFSNNQKELVKQYYKANELLVDCLNNVPQKVRSHIEDTLLLPIAEIREIERHRAMK